MKCNDKHMRNGASALMYSLNRSCKYNIRDQNNNNLEKIFIDMKYENILNAHLPILTNSTY